jgi:hypothetical protein
MNENPLSKQAEHCRQRLTDQQISATGPGTILADIQTMIESIGVAGIATGSQHGNPPFAMLPELNARISQPVSLNLNRPLLRDYPNLAGLLVLLRVMELAVVKEERLAIDEASLARWSSLNPAEKYFALLEAWLIYGTDEVVGTGSPQPSDQFLRNFLFLTRKLSPRWQTFDEHCHVSWMGGCVSAWNTQLQARFGLIEVQPRSLEARRGAARGWIMERARRTPWGDAVGWALIEFLNPKSKVDLRLPPVSEDADFGCLKPVFQPYFPEWQNVWSLAAPAARPGTYVFKVTMDPRRAGATVWRRMAVPGHLSLDELAGSVLDAFKFDDPDHLYEFRYRDDRGLRQCFNHPNTDEGPWAHEITVDECGLPEEQTMKFRFDYGDDWRFDLRLERIEPPDKRLKKCRVLESAGKPPKQYSDWE